MSEHEQRPEEPEREETIRDLDVAVDDADSVVGGSADGRLKYNDITLKRG